MLRTLRLFSSHNNTYGIIKGLKQFDHSPLLIYNNKSFKIFQSHMAMHPNYMWQKKYHAIINENNEMHKNNQKSISNFNLKLFEENIKSSSCDITLNLVGDRSARIGTIMSSIITNPNFKLVLFGACPDLLIPHTPYENCHKMPLSIVCGMASKYIFENNIFEWLRDKPTMDFNNIIYIGIRDIDDKQAEIIAKHNITVLYVDDIKENRINKLIEKIKNCDVHISFDINSFDPKYFNLTNTLVPNGLSLYDTNYLITKINKYSNVFKLDIMDFNPFSYTGCDINTIDEKRQECINIIINNVLFPTFITKAMQNNKY